MLDRFSAEFRSFLIATLFQISIGILYEYLPIGLGAHSTSVELSSRREDFNMKHMTYINRHGLACGRT